MQADRALSQHLVVGVVLVCNTFQYPTMHTSQGPHLVVGVVLALGARLDEAVVVQLGQRLQWM